MNGVNKFFQGERFLYSLKVFLAILNLVICEKCEKRKIP